MRFQSAGRLLHFSFYAALLAVSSQLAELGLGKTATAAPAPGLISIVIDDLGYQHALGKRVTALPGPVVCAFLPHTPHQQELMARAAVTEKEIILHMPLQPRGHRHNPGPGAVLTNMTENQVMNMVNRNLESVPYAVGVNNHMGSLATANPQIMTWIMQAMRQEGGLFFLDSRTTGASVAHDSAVRFGIPSTKRDVFLDTERGAAAVQRQFNQLLSIARRRGSAVAIGHPYPETIALLERELPRLQANDIQLVPLSELIEFQRAVQAQRAGMDTTG